MLQPRPNNPKALNLSDIKPGLRFRTINSNFGVGYGVETVVDWPFCNKSDYKDYVDVKVRVKDVRGNVREHFLADLGVVPYSQGQWNPVNHCEAVDPSYKECENGYCFKEAEVIVDKHGDSRANVRPGRYCQRCADSLCRGASVVTVEKIK